MPPTRTPRARHWLSLSLPLLALLAAAGCDGGSEEIGPVSAARPGSASLPPGPDGAPPAKDAPKPKVAHAMIGDRMANAVYMPVNPTIPQDPSPFRFTDIVPGSGIDFQQVSGMDEEKHFPSANGSGLAILDYDNDGLYDLYFATSTYIPVGSRKTGPNKLYKNLGNGKFEDVTARAGVGFEGFCHGVIAGDIDNDGDADLVLCNYGPNVLYRNNGDGTFADVTKAAGLDRPGWSSGGAFLDADNDGDLDLYIANYGEWLFPQDNKFCGDPDRNLRLYCSPREIRTAQHFFYRNNGDGTFTECAEEVGLGRGPTERGHGFGVVTCDLDDDGDTDLYVANDMNPNFLFLNKGDGTFHDATEESGAAYDDKGNAQSGMGIDAEDVDGDGRPELFVTNFANEYNTLYQNLGNGTFYDQTPTFGLAADSMPWVSWGCGFVDLDHDGWVDLFVGNGHVDNNREGVPYGEPPLIHRNVGLGDGPDASRRFKLSTRDVGPYVAGKHVARGVAFGDLDNDGDTDVAVNHKDAPPAVLRNDTPTDNGWIRLKLVGTRSNRDAIGAKVTVKASGRDIVRHRKGGASLESAHDLRLLIGIGAAKQADTVTIRWPSGTVTTLENVPSGTSREVVEPKEPPATAAVGR
jgi:hypothetical protein